MKTEMTMELFQAAILALFPNGQMGMVKIMGSPSWSFVNVPNKAAAPYGIYENCRSHAKFMLHQEKNGVSIEFLSGRLYDTVKFRKINAKNEAEALTKFVAWFEKNKTIISTLS